MKHFLSHPFLLCFFFIITTLFGLVAGNFEKNMLTKISVFNLIVVDAFFSNLILILIMLFRKISIKDVYNDFKYLKYNELLYFSILGIFGTFIGITSSTMLKYHSIGKIEMIGFFTSLIITALALHFMGEKKLDVLRVFGVFLIGGGGYFLMRE